VLRKGEFARVFTAQTATEAEAVVRQLKTQGLHPADLGVTAPLPFPINSGKSFPVEVPLEEEAKAKKALNLSPKAL
jgi:hypothetical protein